jgi:hypothetical protein
MKHAFMFFYELSFPLVGNPSSERKDEVSRQESFWASQNDKMRRGVHV